jgi:hypothetical protein
MVFAAAHADASAPAVPWWVYADAYEINAGAATPLDITVTVYDDEYGTTATSALLCVAVITAYCLITTIYFA